MYVIIGSLCWSYGGTDLQDLTLLMYMLSCTAVVMWPFLVIQNFLH